MDQQKIRDRASKVLEIAQGMAEKLDRKHGGYSASNAIEEIRLHFNGFAESGDQDHEVVVLGNWNSFRIWDKATNAYLKDECPLRGRLEKIFETLGVQVEWSENWDTCSDCYALIRVQPTHYGWLPGYMTTPDGERVCRHCVAKHAASYLSDLEDNPDNALTLSNVDPCEHGYKKLDEVYETGFHPGQNDDPKAVAKKLRDLGISRFLFQITGAGQFDMNWVVYVHEDEFALLTPEEAEEEDDAECEEDCHV